MALTAPLDGRITSQNVLTGTLDPTSVMEIVSPGNAAAGNTYQVSITTLAEFMAAWSLYNATVITAGATSGSPYDVQTTDTAVLFNKTIGSASYALMPLAASMVYPGRILFKDLKGDAATNNIQLTFSGGQLCDGLSSLTIKNAYGWFWIAPIPAGTGWYQCG